MGTAVFLDKRLPLTDVTSVVMNCCYCSLISLGRSFYVMKFADEHACCVNTEQRS